MEITEKVAYLKGFIDALEIDPATKEGKILTNILDILEDMAFELQDHRNDIVEISDGLDAVSDDLEDVEDLVYGGSCGCGFDDEDEEDDEDDEACYATTCPTCEETVYFDESILEDGGVTCPNCGEKLEFNLTDLDLDELDEEEEDD